MSEPRRTGSRPPRRSAILALPALLLVLAAGGAALSACGSTPTREPAPQKIDPQRLANAYATIVPTRAEDLSHPYTTGKIVVVSKGEDDAGHTLSEAVFNTDVPWEVEQLGRGDLMADVVRLKGGSTLANSEVVAHPDDVGTVVWISCAEVFAGSYTNGEESYRTDCTATIIDATKNLVVAENTSSLDPPHSVQCPVGQTCGPYYGGFDHEGFSKYLVALPRHAFTAPVVP